MSQSNIRSDKKAEDRKYVHCPNSMLINKLL